MSHTNLPRYTPSFISRKDGGPDAPSERPVPRIRLRMSGVHARRSNELEHRHRLPDRLRVREVQAERVAHVQPQRPRIIRDARVTELAEDDLGAVKRRRP